MKTPIQMAGRGRESHPKDRNGSLSHLEGWEGSGVQFGGPGGIGRHCWMAGRVGDTPLVGEMSQHTHSEDG